MQILFSLGLLLISPTALQVFAHTRIHWLTLHAKSDQAICDPDIPSRPSPEPAGASDHDDGPQVVCREGEYLDWYKCSPCEEGTFTTRQMVKSNRLTRCQKCQVPAMYEIVTEPCTSTRDSRIMCENELYRYQVPGKPCLSACLKCDVCGVGRNMFLEFEGRACGGHNNTVCCPGQDMIVVDGRCAPATTTTTRTTANAGPTTRWTILIPLPQDLQHEREHPAYYERVDFIYSDPSELIRSLGADLKMDFKLLLLIYNFCVAVVYISL